MKRLRHDWAGAAIAAIEAGEPCALVSVLAVEGSTPREAGTRMTVTAERCSGTIGGGNLEYQAITQARSALEQAPGTWRIQDYPLGPLLNQCCGGRVRLMVERLDPAHATWLRAAEGQAAHALATRLHDGHVERRPLAFTAASIEARGAFPVAGDEFIESFGGPLTPLLMFGAGHVGRAVARVVEGLPFDVTWLDSRADAEGAVIATPSDMAARARGASGLVLILTHDHALDYDLTRAALGGRAGFIGLIGSATKRARFFSRLKAEGVTDDDLARVHCPVGLPGIAGKAPEIIAVAIAAQLLTVRQ